MNMMVCNIFIWKIENNGSYLNYISVTAIIKHLAEMLSTSGKFLLWPLSSPLTEYKKKS